MEPPDHIHWKSDNDKIEEGVGALDSDHKDLEVITSPWHSRVPRFFDRGTFQRNCHRGSNKPEKAYDANNGERISKSSIRREYPLIKTEDAELGRGHW
jgi:hypothetical protein